jgi:hypothetical protein
MLLIQAYGMIFSMFIHMPFLPINDLYEHFNMSLKNNGSEMPYMGTAQLHYRGLGNLIITNTNSPVLRL